MCPPPYLPTRPSPQLPPDLEISHSITNDRLQRQTQSIQQTQERPPARCVSSLADDVCWHCCLCCAPFHQGRSPRFLRPRPLPPAPSIPTPRKARLISRPATLRKAIDAYYKALEIEPDNPELWAELARIQVYSTSQITTDAGKKTRLEQAWPRWKGAGGCAREQHALCGEGFRPGLVRCILHCR